MSIRTEQSTFTATLGNAAGSLAIGVPDGDGEQPDRIGAELARGHSYTCECGRVLRVFGGGRHQVYFELRDALLDNPVMDGACPACEQALPGKNAARRTCLPVSREKG